MPQDIPQDIPGLLADVQNFINIVVVTPAQFGLTAAQVAALQNAATEAQSAVNEAATTRATLASLFVIQKEKLDALETLYRQDRRIVQANPTTTDADRAALHLATGEKDSSATAHNAAEFAAAPLLNVEQAGVHSHQINFFMEGKASGSTKKPAWAQGCKLFLKIDGAASTDLADYQMIALDTRSPYVYSHDAADAGKTVHYIGAWADEDGAQGGQSEAFSLMIT